MSAYNQILLKTRWPYFKKELDEALTYFGGDPKLLIHPHGSGPTRSMDVFLEEDWNGEEKPQAGRDRLEAPAG